MSTKFPRLIPELPDRVDLEARFAEMLDECYSFTDVGGPFAHMQPSRVLRECDETAFRCGVADMSDDENIVEFEGEYYDRREFRDAVNRCIDEVGEEIAELDAEMNADGYEMNADDDDTMAELSAELTALEGLL